MTNDSEILIKFVDNNNKQYSVMAMAGQSLLDAAIANGVELDGMCGGACACSTCHVIVLDEEYYIKTGKKSMNEEDMLDIAYGVAKTSRLACQVFVTSELHGMTVRIMSRPHM